jgi:hypothetical protein
MNQRQEKNHVSTNTVTVDHGQSSETFPLRSICYPTALQQSKHKLHTIAEGALYTSYPRSLGYVAIPLRLMPPISV